MLSLSLLLTFILYRGYFIRYFNFQMANIVVTIGTVSFVSLLRSDLSSSDVPILFVQTFPKTGAYFIELLMMKIMLGLPWELSRVWAGFQFILVSSCTDRRQWTKRSQKAAYLTSPKLLFGWVYPSALSVMVIVMTYQVLTPLVSVFGLVYFSLGELVYKNNALYVYSADADSGGAMWNSVFKRLVIGLAFAHVVLACFLFVQGAYIYTTIVLALLVADFNFMIFCRHRYQLPTLVLPLEKASEKDALDRERRAFSRCRFTNQTYEQPSLRFELVTEEPFHESELH